jgi:pyruvate-formate lyase-activating enzyme
MGAEALCDPTLPEILLYLKQTKGSSVSLLTNGKKRAPLSMIDEIVFSIKAITPSLHRDYTGEDNASILQNFMDMGGQKSVRLYAETVFIPGYVNEPEVMKIAKFIASVDRHIPFRIDAYLPMPGLPWRAVQTSEIEAVRDRVQEMLPNTTCLHGDYGRKMLAYEIERVF